MYTLPPQAAGMIVVTFSDPAQDTSVPLGAYHYATPALLALYWGQVPAFAGTTQFTADLHTPAGLVETREVSAEWVADFTQCPITQLVDAGRLRLDRYLLQQTARALLPLLFQGGAPPP